LTAALGACVQGIGLLGPGLADWEAAAAVLTGASSWTNAATVLPPPQLLPPAERRRTGAIVKLTLAAGLEATRRAAVNAAELAAVFTSSEGDGVNCHEICQMLASDDRQLSPTRFHNSVHNAASGYWGIATGATRPVNALCGHDASFGAGLLEALTQVAIERIPVLLIAYDVGYPEPIHAARPIPDAFAVALLLGPARQTASLAWIEAHLTDASADILSTTSLEGLRRAIPAARALPLLERLAAGRYGDVVLDYLPQARLRVAVTPCR
jgi:hypothetical protein